MRSDRLDLYCCYYNMVLRYLVHDCVFGGYGTLAVFGGYGTMAVFAIMEAAWLINSYLFWPGLGLASASNVRCTQCEVADT